MKSANFMELESLKYYDFVESTMLMPAGKATILTSIRFAEFKNDSTRIEYLCNPEYLTKFYDKIRRSAGNSPQ